MGVVVMESPGSWQGNCRLRFQSTPLRTVHQGGTTAPFKLMKAVHGADRRCELPLLHTAGGLVGGDQLNLDLDLAQGSRCLITSVAAQKVYGSIGRSKRHPDGMWARQTIQAKLAEQSDLEWLPQEMVIYANALFEQKLTVELSPQASFLSADIIRLGRTAAGEDLGRGCWRSEIKLKRLTESQSSWELVDRLELEGDSLRSNHGLAGEAVLGSFVWAAPMPLNTETLKTLLNEICSDRVGLEGTMRCSALNQGLIARYIGPSSRDARFWFCRIWRRTRIARSMSKPAVPRSWPLQEDPFQRIM